ncbi:glycine betaine/L-proline ABC transporter substrate-binding protein ProX [Pseudomonas gingeri]|uniref:Glycine betaine/L-proline ABC transporter substrate-binding protein ProX n=2 Tax=Pseudomonas gingeri TaxID=117681 RepID=A0A7Y7YGU6_9PSED|nr:glycine betaine/L-proline ABC transporter substrate-binding protein ProX [Pseudomonas gingeri]NWA04538.1 glycine betaine/L-proline ABC transporter substrate-binding protein ProX [Pseudomonas gingeri]NWA17347.1 glycine betaine/L-proline ABC transporter substrate-binding protein ProX [Pseudomonas gingeri]NWA56369.1 glycine betaine/L-proline ABC transporter substrate-binding protein ProX [Pseudomonas gingeri]NWA98069.1 glycine betaine/L-proline ABC transporter substrate-binding protein ProX [Ps
MNFKFKTLLATVTAGALACTMMAASHAADLPGEGRTIRMSQADSMGANYVVNRIVKDAFSQLGYDVKLSTLSSVLFFEAAANGDLDVAVDLNFPQRQPSFDKVKDQLVKIGPGAIEGGGYNGYMIDKKTADQYGITSLEQFKDPKIAGLFGKDGKANMISCDPGWSCDAVIQYQVDKFGLRNTIRTVTGKYEALMFETIAKVKRGEPVLFYAWIPSWMTAALVPGKDVVWLPTPFDALPEAMHSTQSALTPGVPGCAGNADPCRMAMAAWNWQSVGNKEFIAANPAVKALLEQVSFPLQAWSSWEQTLSEKRASETTIRKLADEWIAQNKAVFDGWVAKAKAVK